MRVPRKAEVFVRHVVVGVGLFGALAFCGVPEAGGQEPVDTAAMEAEMDSLLSEVEVLLIRVDSLQTAIGLPEYEPAEERDWTDMWAFRGEMEPADYALYLGLAVTANAIWKIDRDVGGYEDRWTTYDKLAHFNVAHFLADQAMERRVSPRWAFALTCAAATAFEFSQGWPSWKDATVSCGGAAFAVLNRRLREQTRTVER